MEPRDYASLIRYLRDGEPDPAAVRRLQERILQCWRTRCREDGVGAGLPPAVSGCPEPVRPEMERTAGAYFRRIRRIGQAAAVAAAVAAAATATALSLSGSSPAPFEARRMFSAEVAAPVRDPGRVLAARRPYLAREAMERKWEAYRKQSSGTAVQGMNDENNQ